MVINLNWTTDYFVWSAGSADQLLFIFLTRVSLTTITLHYYSDSAVAKKLGGGGADKKFNNFVANKGKQDDAMQNYTV